VVDFAKLKLVGFKSFVDPTEFAIEPGLTGIVGPNGCGKSNLLEALRWCMGEGSARQLRGAGIDDVIFNGTTDRPARNLAEVSLVLDNRDRRAPAPFGELEEIEIVRRVEREMGSAYRINGRDFRMRDVQLLFADLSSGARSTAIVGQGRVGALIAAKPPERRLLLEEAAGITGLHSRRHEAELRLRAAEQNLSRLNDVVTALDGQLQGLKRQARQATRYRNIAEHLRKLEAVLLHLRWQAGVAERERAGAALAEIEREIAALAAETARLATGLAEAGAALPALRHDEAAAGALRERAASEIRAVEVERARIEDRQREAEQRLVQIDADRAREETLLVDAAAAEQRLDDEAQRLAALAGAERDAATLAALRVSAAEAGLAAVDGEVTALTRKIAADDARRMDMDRRVAEREARVADIARRLDQVARERRQFELALDAAAIDAAAAAAAAAETAAAAARAASDAAERRRAEADEAARLARRALDDAAETHRRLAAEAQGIAAALASGAGPEARPVLDRVSVGPGFEAALGAALGDDLGASLDAAADRHWRLTAADGAPPALPAGARPLNAVVTAPAELARRLAQIGVVENDADGDALAPRLAQGQRLVSRAGALWRWDGYVRRAGAATAATVRLQQLNRLNDVEAEAATAAAEARDRQARFDALAATAAGEAEALSARRDELRLAESALAARRQVHARAEREAVERTARLAALGDAKERMTLDAADAAERLDEARAERAALPPEDADAAALAALRATLAERRARHAGELHAANRLSAEAEIRRQRLAAAAEERRTWSQRRADGLAHVQALAERRRATESERADLAGRPAALEAEKSRLVAAMDAAETRRRAAADALAAAEARQAEADRALKAAERALADRREARGRAEGALAQAAHALGEIGQRIAEKLACPPEAALAEAGLAADAPVPALGEVEPKIERLVRERENMGPVNLRAEQEAQELDAQIKAYESERADLTAAIERFRKAIQELNREGRERLMASFNAVNGHFERLFARLFGGGKAHLQLVEADDPLESGLEVMASPPGKRLQSLSLLSGGEQALTALALLFAVFLTNPAPICVLDEVDAPLDDANVDRFCTLVEDIAKETHTRFLIVTHHRMTMARMNRLYGVTMVERGVSRLVSVDLEEASTLRHVA
jgi:chromosome segregation protein